MKSKLQLWLIMITCLTFSKVTVSQTVYSNYVDGNVYVKLLDTCTLQLVHYNYSNLALNAIFAMYNVDTALTRQPFPNTLISVPLTKVFRLRFHDSTLVDSLIAHLMTVPIVQYAEKIPFINAIYTPNDFNNLQWQLPKISAFQAFDITHGSSSVVIAIVDNAILTTHQDLTANITGGYDVADNDNNPNPPNGAMNNSPWVHGTHTSGIASAVTDNGIGIASIGFNTKIMPIKCSPDTSNGSYLTNAFDGVYYAMGQNVNVISMSWGGTGQGLTDQSILNTAHSMGITLVAAAGNNNSNGAFYPADYTYVIAVGATDANDVKSSYSNYGSSIAVMAPGDNIYSTFCGSTSSYGTLSGTSMACPLVAGLAALVKAVHPAYTPDQIETAIRNGCDNINAQNNAYIGQIGSGRINAFHTLSPAGIAEIKGTDYSIKIYPEPNNGIFNVQYHLTSPDNTLQLSDITGRVVYNQSISGMDGNQNIDISSLNNGVYFFKMISGNTVSSTGKIVVAK
jgi:serine protease